MTINDSHDLHTLAKLGGPDGIPSALGAGEGDVDESFAFVNRATFPEFVGQIIEDFAQNIALAPWLELPMDGRVVGVALRQHVPLRPGVEFHSTPSSTERVGIGFRPGRPSGRFSPGK